MKSPQELKTEAWNVGWPIVLVALGILFGALGMSLCHCSLFTPNIDPKDYPCGDPRMQSCGNGGCCWTWQACIGGPNTTDPNGKPRCEDIGNTWSAAGAPDAGADR